MLIFWSWLKTWFSARELSKVRYKSHDLGNCVSPFVGIVFTGFQFSHSSYVYGYYCGKLLELETCLVIYAVCTLSPVMFRCLNNLDFFDAALPINYDEFI